MAAMPQPNTIPQILVVAGDSNSSAATSGLWYDRAFLGSNTGALVDLAAPAVRVAALNQNGTIDTVTGTSLSAPQVSGTLGLLLAFNPADSTADSLISYVKHGAIDGGWTSGGFPMLNSYKALRRAARNTSAPLCGNRVYDNAGSLYVQRNDSAATSDQLLDNTVNHYSQAVPHGGRSVYFASDTAWLELDWSSTGWTLNPDTAGENAWYNTLDTVIPSINLQRHMTHDGDSLVMIYDSTSDTAITWALAIAVNSATPSYVPFTTMKVGSSYGSAAAAAYVSYSAALQKLLITIDYGSGGANIYTMPVAVNATPTLVWTSNDSTYFGWLESSEDGTEVSGAFGFGSQAEIIWFSPTGSSWTALRTTILSNYNGSVFAASKFASGRVAAHADSQAVLQRAGIHGVRVQTCCSKTKRP